MADDRAAPLQRNGRSEELGGEWEIPDLSLSGHRTARPRSTPPRRWQRGGRRRTSAPQRETLAAAGRRASAPRSTPPARRQWRCAVKAELRTLLPTRKPRMKSKSALNISVAAARDDRQQRQQADHDERHDPAASRLNRLCGWWSAPTKLHRLGPAYAAAGNAERDARGATRP